MVLETGLKVTGMTLSLYNRKRGLKAETSWLKMFFKIYVLTKRNKCFNQFNCMFILIKFGAKKKLKGESCHVPWSGSKKHWM